MNTTSARAGTSRTKAYAGNGAALASSAKERKVYAHYRKKFVWGAPEFEVPLEELTLPDGRRIREYVFGYSATDVLISLADADGTPIESACWTE